MEGLQGGDEGIDVVGTGGPTGDEAAIHHVAHGVPLLEDKIFLQASYRGLVQEDELLVGGRVAIHLVTLADEGVTQSHRLLNGMAGNLEVEAIGHQGVELDAQQATLCQQGPVLLDDGEEMGRGIVMGKNDGFATIGTTLGAAQVEHVAQVGQLL